MTTVETSGVRLHYRQRLQVPGRDPVTTGQVLPRELTVRVRRGRLCAQASYAG